MFRCISCVEVGEKDEAKNRNKQLSLLLKQWKKEEAKIVKLLLLGPGESGKSTITKQMKIIHINGFTHEEKTERKQDIKKNIRDSILSILGAMNKLHIDLEDENLQDSVDYLNKIAEETDFNYPQEFFDHVEKLWADNGVQACYRRSNEYQLIDCAKYFLDKVSTVREENYSPDNQDILRCRVMTNTIQRIDFKAPDGAHDINFSVYDVGGQRGERRKWIQVFDAASAILFILDSSSFDLTLREDTTKNRMMEAIETFDHVFNSRWLRHVSMILFINKTDLLEEKINEGKSFQNFVDSLDPTDKYYSYFQGYSEFHPKEAERHEFIEAISHTEENLKLNAGKSSKKLGRTCSFARTDVNEEFIRAAVFIKKVFMEIVSRPRQDDFGSDWHADHTCEYYYTCAVDTDNIRKVMEGCRAIIIKHHLKIWGLGLS